MYDNIKLDKYDAHTDIQVSTNKATRNCHTEMKNGKKIVSAEFA